jgi:hypothetical protein
MKLLRYCRQQKKTLCETSKQHQWIWCRTVQTVVEKRVSTVDQEMNLLSWLIFMGEIWLSEHFLKDWYWNEWIKQQASWWGVPWCGRKKFHTCSTLTIVGKTHIYVEEAYTLTSHTVTLGGLVVALYPRYVSSNLAWKRGFKVFWIFPHVLKEWMNWCWVWPNVSNGIGTEL